MVVRRNRRPVVVVVVALAMVVALAASGCGPSQREHDLRQSNQALVEQVGVLKADLASAQREREQAQTDLAQAKQERDAAKKSLADAEAHAAMLGQGRDAATGELQAAQAQIDVMAHKTTGSTVILP